jgi:hypothetical protein
MPTTTGPWVPSAAMMKGKKDSSKGKETKSELVY